MCKKMKTLCLSSDIINMLPQNIVEKILTLMPIRDALRTSILSKKWRYCWMGMPKLEFDDKLVEIPSKRKRLEIHKLVNAIFHILLLHKGPLLEFKFASKLHIGYEFDPVILYLSRINNVKSLIFEFTYRYYELPHSFFSLTELEVLELTNCDFKPILTFNGLSKLRSVLFRNVKISAKMLLHFLANCPLLEEVILTGYQENFEGGNEFTFVELLRCVPLLTTVDISEYYMKYLVVAPMPQKLSTSLVHLINLYLDVCLMEQDEISCALCLIRSSPFLEDITFLMYDNKELPVRQTSTNFLDLQYYSDLNLVHLEDFEIRQFSFLPVEMEFVKLIMAKSPVLKTARLVINDDVSVDEEVKMLRGLIEVPLPHASPSAKLIIERPKTSS